MTIVNDPHLLTALGYPADLPCYPIVITDAELHDVNGDPTGERWTGQAHALGILVESGPSEHYAPELMVGKPKPALMALEGPANTTLWIHLIRLRARQANSSVYGEKHWYANGDEIVGYQGFLTGWGKTRTQEETAAAWESLRIAERAIRSGGPHKGSGRPFDLEKLSALRVAGHSLEECAELMHWSVPYFYVLLREARANGYVPPALPVPDSSQ